MNPSIDARPTSHAHDDTQLWVRTSSVSAPPPPPPSFAPPPLAASSDDDELVSSAPEVQKSRPRPMSPPRGPSIPPAALGLRGIIDDRRGAAKEGADLVNMLAEELIYHGQVANAQLEGQTASLAADLWTAAQHTRDAGCTLARACRQAVACGWAHSRFMASPLPWVVAGRLSRLGKVPAQGCAALLGVALGRRRLHQLTDWLMLVAERLSGRMAGGQ